MVVIRLSRGGSKGKPFYHMVVADVRSPRDGKILERLGFFNPSPQGQDTELKLDLARVDHWISKGAQPTDTAKDLIKRARKLNKDASAA